VIGDRVLEFVENHRENFVEIAQKRDYNVKCGIHNDLSGGL
jgi:hypothetical protein